MKKIIYILLFAHITFHLFSQTAGSRLIEINDCSYPILGIQTVPNTKKTVITASQGRIFLLNTDDLASSDNVKAIWKNFDLSGFNMGGKPQFSSDEKYILLQESSALKTAINSKKVKDIKYAVLDAETGKTIFEGDNANSAQFINGKTQLLISTDNGIIIKDFTTKTVINELKIDNCEMACIDPAIKTIAISYDPDKSDFKEVESIGANKKELKNAIKNKRLIAFYSYPDLKKINQSAEELDMIYSLKFTQDSKTLLVFSHNVVAERAGTAGMNNMTMGAADVRRQSNIQAIDAISGKLIKDFYHATAEIDSDHKLNFNETIFGYSDNDGWTGWKRKIMLFNKNDHTTKIGLYRYQGKKGSSNIFPMYFSFHPNKELVYITNGSKLIEWDYKVLPEYTNYIEGNNTDTLELAAIRQLNKDVEDFNSSLFKTIQKNNITGIYVLNITIQKKGEVITVFAESDEKTHIPSQNMLKDIMLKYKFEDIKLASNQKLKIKYTFNINP
jgi:hypothetical protein